MEDRFKEPKFEKEKQYELDQISRMADTFENGMSLEVKKLYDYVNARLNKLRYYTNFFFIGKDIDRIKAKIDKVLESQTLGDFDELVVLDLRQQVEDFLDYDYVLGPVEEKPKKTK